MFIMFIPPTWESCINRGFKWEHSLYMGGCVCVPCGFLPLPRWIWMTYFSGWLRNFTKVKMNYLVIYFFLVFWFLKNDFHLDMTSDIFRWKTRKIILSGRFSPHSIFRFLGLFCHYCHYLSRFEPLTGPAARWLPIFWRFVASTQRLLLPDGAGGWIFHGKSCKPWQAWSWTMFLWHAVVYCFNIYSKKYWTWVYQESYNHLLLGYHLIVGRASVNHVYPDYVWTGSLLVVSQSNPRTDHCWQCFWSAAEATNDPTDCGSRCRHWVEMFHGIPRNCHEIPNQVGSETILSDDRHIIGKPNDCQQQCHTFENIIYIYICMYTVYIYIYVYIIYTHYSETTSGSPWLINPAMKILMVVWKVQWEMIKHLRWIRKRSTGDLTQILWQNQKQWCAFLG